MDELQSYKSNCDYIRKTFELPESTNLYALVNKITESYKDLKDKEEIKSISIAEPTLKEEKKRGRPRKSGNSN